MASTLKQRVHELVEVTPDEAGRKRFDWFDISLAVLIVLNVIAVMLETVAVLQRRYHDVFIAFEVFSVTVFTIEYILRLWACTADPEFAHPVKGRLRYAARPLAIVDLLAILPSLLPYIWVDLRFIRVLRLLRLLRVLKLGHYSEAVALLVNVLRSRSADLAVMLIVLGMLLVLSSGAIFYAENEAQPDVFSSIPASLWWAVITLTTIGYGDAYPVTVAGKLVGGVIAVLGIGIVALPTAIIATGFAEEVQRRRNRGKGTGEKPAGTICPHCGKPIELAAPAP
ncbi:MAG TPA: ion transporter [Tepidisphaeraceae bacterium]|nr:ion transporter [Tepidisphaeraceae bacterium]